MPLDRFKREIDYLRISLTDHCNLRCVYCMSLSDVDYAPPAESLTPEEVERVVQAAASIGFRKVRLTGGEPTLRPDLVDIVRRVASVPGIEDVAMTTNGILLSRMAVTLRRAGLRRVNIHVDTFDPERLSRVMRWGKLSDIERGIASAIEAGFSPLKLNCVVTRGYNDEDVVEMARTTLERDWHIRFIELMPLGGGECARVSQEHYVSNVETRARIENAPGPLEAIEPAHPADESRNFRAPDARGVVGFISPVSEPYCGTCNRMRLTSDGQFHLCLLKDDELDVHALLRNGASREELAELLQRAVAAKPTGHSLALGQPPRDRSMHHLGG